MPDLKNLEPFRDRQGRVVEPSSKYVQRMQSGLLPNWPVEVLIEWLHRHAGSIQKYAYLDFRTFVFSKEIWPLDQIPGGEAFDDAKFYKSFSSNLEHRARDPHDWLARYMFREGTWNTPIVLLKNDVGQHVFPHGGELRQPYHLLEGHRRLSFLGALKARGRALAQHEVWLVVKAL